MLEHLGESESAGLVMEALRHVARHGPRTRDLGGTATTIEMGKAVATAVGAASANA